MTTQAGNNPVLARRTENNFPFGEYGGARGLSAPGAYLPELYQWFRALFESKEESNAKDYQRLGTRLPMEWVIVFPFIRSVIP
jgi:hypothetical protein